MSQPVVAGKAFSMMFNTQFNFWGFVATAAGVNVGSKTKGGSQKLFPPYGAAVPQTNTGFLGNIPTSYYTPDNFIDFNDTSITFEPRPYYTPLDTDSEDFEEVNEKLLAILDDVVLSFNNLTEPTKDSTQQELYSSLSSQFCCCCVVTHLTLPFLSLKP